MSGQLEHEVVSARSLPTGSICRGAGEVVLVVEDEPVVRRMAEWILRKARYSVIGATRGHEAIEICKGREQPIDLLLTDVMMPGMPGPELVKRVLGIRPELRILYMSGSARETLRSLTLGDDSGSAFIAKPFRAQALLATVRELLDRR